MSFQMTSIDDIPIQPDKAKHPNLRNNITTTVSIAALLFSGLSLWISWKNAAFQKTLARPLLESGKAFILRTEEGKTGSAALSLGVYNTGQQTAFISDVSARPLSVGDNGIVYMPVECLNNPDNTTPESGTEIQVHNGRPFIVPLTIGEGCPLQEKQLFRVKIRYQDKYGNEYIQFFNVTAKQTNLPPAPNH
jgi:hypothetical protein